MIGQKRLLNKIEKLAQSGFPRFVMLVGAKGSGKKLVAKQIAELLNYPLVPIGVSVEEVREVIVNSYRNTEPIVYVLSDTDKMSVQAKNALLKVTEEPPQKAYFILTVSDTVNTLQTLISRACVLKMDEYTGTEILEYLTNKYPNRKLSELDEEFIMQVALVPQEVDTLMTYDVKEFREFVRTVTENLHTVSAANAFKFEQNLALKKDEDKWDVLIFMQALRVCYLNEYFYTGEVTYLKSSRLVQSVIQELKYKNSVNKQYCLDQFVLTLREYWRTYQ